MPTEQTDTTQTTPEEITYTPTVWADGADGGTPINAANLNNMEEAIVALVERTTKQVVTSMIADGAVTSAKLDQTLRDSLSQANSKLSFGSGIKSMGVWGTKKAGMTFSFVYSDETSCRIDILSNGTVKVS